MSKKCELSEEIEKMGIEEDYKELSGQHDLPEFEQFDQEFEISNIDCENFPLREVRRKMMERFDYYARILQEIFQPDPNSGSIFEAKNFSDEEREQIFQLYCKIMAIMRHSVVVSLDNTDKQNAKFIADSYSDWMNMKGKVLPIAIRIKSTWDNNHANKLKEDYFG